MNLDHAINLIKSFNIMRFGSYRGIYRGKHPVRRVKWSNGSPSGWIYTTVDGLGHPTNGGRYNSRGNSSRTPKSSINSRIGRGRGPVMCYSCGHPGHVALDCMASRL